jgi:hypothetical protein
MKSFWMLLTFAVTLQASAWPQTASPDDYSGLYSFLRDGEFIQISIEDPKKVSGFISRYGDSESDKGTFLDQFVKSGAFESGKLTFTTEIVHGAWFTFEGSISRGNGKTTADEGFYVMRGTLIRYDTDSEKKTTSQSRKVEFKSFPRDASSN